MGYPRTTNNPFLNWPFIDIFWYLERAPDPSVGRHTVEVVELSAPTLQSLMDDGRRFDVGTDMCDTASSQRVPGVSEQWGQDEGQGQDHGQGQDLDLAKDIIMK